jgi:PP-loop superfamily ATP-utilizing enzyme
VKSAGYTRVALDLEGFRSGNLNQGVAVGRAGAAEVDPPG